ncbi:TadE/TadG family type IV pilus assembly protein [Sphingomonas sp. RS6]
MSFRRKRGRVRGLLGRLRSDVRANTLALMTMALIPLAGMVGGGVDISRMYIVKTRLQHACDAGALAGRKAMGGGTWGQTLNGTAYYPRVSAERFFDANYNTAAYGATNVSRSFTENAGKVTGTASARVPMTIMRIFGRTTQTLTVSCEADMRLPNTDVMFVLDTTGSMGDVPQGDNQTKLASLKVAVKCFYEIVARLDTDANCTTGTPGGGTGNQVQIRFGFVPYATNVNVGKLLPADYFANTWYYQTREQNGTAWGAWYDSYYTSKSKGICVAPANTSTTQYSSSATGWSGSYACLVRQRNLVPNWRYDRLPVNVGLLKSGSSWNASYSFTLPINDNGGNRTITWDGCIEERTTVSQSSYDPIPADAKDLDIDLVPSAGDADSLWAPALSGVIFTREDGNGNWTRDPVETTTNFGNESNYYCPTQAKKLQTWPSASDFDSYVNSLTASGNTYHDIGLLWGGRLASPTGIFQSENQYTAQGGEIERHLIFMTDGDPCTHPNNYNAYGVGWYDRRTTGSATLSLSQNCTQGAPITDQVNARTQAICTAIKNKNITLWVITFGQLDSRTVTRMRSCASTGRYFSANNAAEIQQTFKTIADQISALRLVN